MNEAACVFLFQDTTRLSNFDDLIGSFMLLQTFKTLYYHIDRNMKKLITLHSKVKHKLLAS